MSLNISKRAKNITPSITLSIDSKAKEMQANGIDVISFGAGEPDFDTPVHIREAGKKALDLGLTRYTPVAGTLALREAICKKFEEDNQLKYSPDEIIVSNGAKHSLFNILQCLVDPGDEVIIPSPCWVSYPELIKMAGGIPIYLETKESENFIPSKQDLEKIITPRTKAIILTSPNNPSGVVLSKSCLEYIAELAIKHEFFVISDEIYEKLIYDSENHISIASLNPEIKNQTLIVNGVSKDYAMTGWRIGYAAGPRHIIKAITAFQSQATSNPNSIAQFASIAALTGNQDQVAKMISAFKARRDYMVEKINNINGLSCIKPKGAFYVLVNIKPIIGSKWENNTINDSLSFSKLLLENALVATVPGEAFKADGYLRLSYAIDIGKIKEGLNRIENFVKGLTLKNTVLESIA